ncbi:adenosylhomocysteine nucleosidase [Formivibrio citricus]|uniref:adenosylhomocysteine nucleosidase n=1 Tax=Formivibrio citricus TaxID=83765 RepID=A0A1I5DM77_9NEIS|nr:5'-methylthioadenosine/adenosylhomocysteine nucleosidase [Formivibrio citricus]SFO00332.1 adenosylhomocysteine nucleosidase [Formivibrio citricus]
MIVILGAMESEISEFLSCMQNRQTCNWNGFEHHRGTIDGHEVLVSRSGVGKVKAAMMTQHLIDDYKPRAILFTGLAGSLRPHIAIGDTLVARDLVQHDMDTSGIGYPRGQIPFTDWRFLPADPCLLEIASGFTPQQGSLHIGRICTGDQFITHREMDSHAHLTGELEGDGVEMEGASVAQVCAINKVPCLVARTISDKADGSAAVNFEEFLPRASHNSLDFVRYMLAGM